MNTKTIYLTGFMGSGKSTTGRVLASRLGYLFVDLDEEIVKRADRSISEIFEHEGEPVFRSMESDIIREYAGRVGVFALGGGAILAEANRELLLSTGTMVYLRATPGTLVSRLAKEAAHRPLLSPGKELEITVVETLNRRKQYYETAHLIVDTDELTPNQVAEELVRLTGGN
jgi:shikimate kinase